jgi:hypothetical protein
MPAAAAGPGGALEIVPRPTITAPTLGRVNQVPILRLRNLQLASLLEDGERGGAGGGCILFM